MVAMVSKTNHLGYPWIILCRAVFQVCKNLKQRSTFSTVIFCSVGSSLLIHRLADAAKVPAEVDDSTLLSLSKAKNLDGKLINRIGSYSKNKDVTFLYYTFLA